MELSKLSESHRISHHQAGSTVGSASVEEEHEGITAGIGTLIYMYWCTLYMNAWIPLQKHLCKKLMCQRVCTCT